MIKITAPALPIRELIDGMYAPKSVNDATAVANNTFVPADWANATGGTLDGTALYNGVVKVACRTCHMSSTDPLLDFADHSDFVTYGGAIMADACGTSHIMPHAERVMKNFWQSGARAYLVAAFPGNVFPNGLAACAP